jgi:hypothetical protein
MSHGPSVASELNRSALWPRIERVLLLANMSAGAELQLPPMPWLKPGDQQLVGSSSSSIVRTGGLQAHSQGLAGADSKRARSTALEGEDDASAAAGTDASTPDSTAAADSGQGADAWHTMIEKDLAESVGVWGLWLLVIVIIVALWYVWKNWNEWFPPQEGEGRSVAGYFPHLAHSMCMLAEHRHGTNDLIGMCGRMT